MFINGCEDIGARVWVEKTPLLHMFQVGHGKNVWTVHKAMLKTELGQRDITRVTHTHNAMLAKFPILHLWDRRLYNWY